MTLFRADRTLWSPPSSSISNIVGGGGEKEKKPTSPRSKSRLSKISTKGESPRVEKCRLRTREKDKDSNEFFQVALTSDAVQFMVDSGFITTSVHNDDATTNDEDGDGIVLSTRPTAAGPFVVRLHNLQEQQIRSDDGDSDNKKCGKKNLVIFATSITDGSKSCTGTILQTKEGKLENLAECVLSVSGYVMGVSCSRSESDGNSGDEKNENKPKAASNASEIETKYSPHIYITQYELLYEKRSDLQTDNDKATTIDKWQIAKENDETLSTTKEICFPKGAYQNRGRLATLISSATLAMDDFIGGNQGGLIGQHGHHGCETASKIAVLEDCLEISNFIKQHSAIIALKKTKDNASLLSSSSFSLMLGSLKYFQTYTSAIKEFDEAQREDQFTPLSDMIEEFFADDIFLGGEDTLGSKPAFHDNQSWTQHKETLEYALLCKDETLSSELLLRWHAWLLGDGLEQEAGSFRSEKVSKRVGNLCCALENRWFPKIKEEPTNPTRIASFAAATMLSVLDLVPFRVGNQRLARILLNWTLRRAGLPFCITLYSNREEKLAFLSAVQKTRQNLCLVPQGQVNESEMAVIVRSTGGLGPLVGFLLTRLARATVDFCILVEQKSRMASEETDARLVRIAREKAAEDACIICFENKPNIATLCCGKSIHLNCLTEWLKTNPSCPQCRSDLPSLSVGQETCQRVDDRRVAYGRERISVRGFTSDDFIFHSSSSSSSEDSSSSSSSSSSESSTFFYSGLDYGVNDIRSVTSIDDDEISRSIRSLLPGRSDTPIPFLSQPRSNYVTSDEEEEHDSDSDNGHASSTNSYQSETDDDIHRYSFHTNDSQRSLTYYSSNFELARNDDIDIVSDTQSTGYTDTNEDRYELLNEERSATSEYSSERENEMFSPETYSRPSFITEDFAPFRVSFLDPELLGSVQSGRWSNENSRGDDVDIPETTEFARRGPTDDDVHPFNSVTNSCDFPSRRGVAFPSSRRSR